MGLWSKKKSNDQGASTSGNSQALALQDPRTKVKTTSAATETTSTAVQNSTIINSNENTVTYLSTRQTVTHRQQARVTEMITRRTPSQAELEELMRELRMNGGGANGGTTFKTTTSSSGTRGSNGSMLNGVALRSTPSFKPSTSARPSSTVVKMEQTTVTQKQGRTFTEQVETNRVVLNPTSKTSWAPKSNTSTTSTSSYSSPLSKPYVSPFAIKSTDAYVSPYAAKTTTVTSSAFSKPTAGAAAQPQATKSIFSLSSPAISSSVQSKPTGNSYGLSKPLSSSSVLSKPTTSSYGSHKPSTSNSIFTKPSTSSYAWPKPTVSGSVQAKPTVTSNSFGTKPTLSTPKMTLSTGPMISLNPKSGHKRNLSSESSVDAYGEMKPTISVSTPVTKPVPKRKLKPAKVIIFNHEKFDNDNETRDGSAEDVKMLDKTFSVLKCDVQIIQNATISTVKKTISKLELKDWTDRSALVVVVLSHGNRYDRVAAKDGDYRLDDDVIFPILRNRTLIEKPKIFFVQACKGEMEPGKFKTDATQPQGKPTEILKCYSTFEGYVSYREQNGTPFIQTLCDTIAKNPKVDILANMQVVIGLVKEYTQGKQIPSFTSTMTSKYAFGDYI